MSMDHLQSSGGLTRVADNQPDDFRSRRGKLAPVASRTLTTHRVVEIADVGAGSGGKATAPAATHPLQLYVVTVSLVKKVRVRYGSVWGFPPPEVQGGASPVDITPSDGLQVWARVTVDSGGLPTARAIDSGSSVPSNTSTLTYWLIGSITVDGAKVTPNQAVTHSLNGQSCGTGIYNWWGV